MCYQFLAVITYHVTNHSKRRRNWTDPLGPELIAYRDSVYKLLRLVRQNTEQNKGRCLEGSLVGWLVESLCFWT